MKFLVVTPPSIYHLPFEARQHNREKSSAPLRQYQSHTYPFTPPDRRGASAMRIPPPDNQQSP